MKKTSTLTYPKGSLWLLVAGFIVLASLPFLVPRLGFISLIAFVPLFQLDKLIREHNIRHAFWYYYVAFLGFNIATTFWIWFVSAAGAIAAILLNALQMAAVVAMDALQALPFSYLRFQKRPIRFATLKLLFIFFNIGLNLLYFVVLGKTSVFYVFAINLACTSLITLCFIPELFQIQWHFDGALLRRMLSYSWPILILGIAGILNQVADKILFPLVYPDKADANVQLGIYGGCVKIAMIMAMITQAFRYAYEPIVFAKAKDKDSTEYYAVAMKYFLIFTLLAFLCVMGYIDVLQFILGRGYREGMQVVPIVMVAEIMMGVYFNLSFWYKLIDKTIYGAVFSLIGCAVLFLVNILFIPQYSYMACAWGGVAGYGTAMVLSYIVGQVKNPIPYPMRSIATYVLLTALFYWLMTLVPATWHIVLRLAVNTLLILLFCGHIYWHERSE